jgi:hypothetical protein
VSVATGAMVCSLVLDRDPIMRKNMDMVRIIINEKRRYVNHADTVRFKFVIKYIGILNMIAVETLFGRSQIIEEQLSING